MVVCLDGPLFRRYVRKAPALTKLVKDARRLKESVCAQDPYEQTGLRRVLNFGHSFGHVLESLSRFKLSHGDAVGLGMLCALDVGRTLGITPASVADEVEQAMYRGPGVLGRDRIAHLHPSCAPRRRGGSARRRQEGRQGGRAAHGAPHRHWRLRGPGRLRGHVALPLALLETGTPPMSKPSVRKLHVDPSHLVPARLTPPVSKSDAQRALVLAHLTGHWPLAVLQNEPEADLAADVRVLTRGVETLRLPPGPVRDVDCADGGAPFRIFVTQAAVTPGAKVRITGTPRLGERPHGPLFDSLREALGPSGLVLKEGKPWPVELHAPDRTGEPVFRVPGAQSSQYASSLLLGCAALFLREHRPWSVEIQGPLTSAGYLELTVSWLRRFGFTVEETPSRFTVTAHQPSAHAPPMPGDWSSLGYLLLIAWRTGGSVERADPSSAHPDQAHPAADPARGPHPRPRAGASPCAWRARPGTASPPPARSARTCCPPWPRSPACCRAPPPCTDVSILRLKESDRLEGIRTLVSAYGGATTLDGRDA